MNGYGDDAPMEYDFPGADVVQNMSVAMPPDLFHYMTVTETFFQTVWFALTEGSTKEFEIQEIPGVRDPGQLRGDDCHCHMSHSCGRVIGLGTYMVRPHMCRFCAFLYCDHCMASPARCRRCDATALLHGAQEHATDVPAVLPKDAATQSSSSTEGDILQGGDRHDWQQHVRRRLKTFGEARGCTQLFKSKYGNQWEMVQEAMICLEDLNAHAVSMKFEIASGMARYDWEVKLANLRTDQQQAFYKYMRFLNAMDKEPNLGPHMARVEEQASLLGEMNMQQAMKVKGIEYFVLSMISV